MLFEWNLHGVFVGALCAAAGAGAGGGCCELHERRVPTHDDDCWLVVPPPPACREMLEAIAKVVAAHPRLLVLSDEVRHVPAGGGWGMGGCSWMGVTPIACGLWWTTQWARQGRHWLACTPRVRANRGLACAGAGARERCPCMHLALLPTCG